MAPRASKAKEATPRLRVAVDGVLDSVTGSNRSSGASSSGSGTSGGGGSSGGGGASSGW